MAFKASFILWLMGYPLRVVRECQWLEANEAGLARRCEEIQYAITAGR